MNKDRFKEVVESLLNFRDLEGRLCLRSGESSNELAQYDAKLADLVQKADDAIQAAGDYVRTKSESQEKPPLSQFTVGALQGFLEVADSRNP